MLCSLYLAVAKIPTYAYQLHGWRTFGRAYSEPEVDDAYLKDLL
jgi:hypothetical protein